MEQPHTNGVNHALEDQIADFRPYLIGYLRNRLRCPEDDVENVVQETISKAIKSKDTYRGESLLKTWVTTIATRKFFDLKRKHDKRREVPIGLKINNDNEATIGQGLSPEELDKLSLDHDDHDTPDQLAMTNERIEAVRESLGKLTKDQRDLIEDRYFKGKKYEQIAEERGIPLGTVMSRLHYAKKNLGSLIPNIDDL